MLARGVERDLDHLNLPSYADCVRGLAATHRRRKRPGLAPGRSATALGTALQACRTTLVPSPAGDWINQDLSDGDWISPTTRSDFQVDLPGLLAAPESESAEPAVPTTLLARKFHVTKSTGAGLKQSAVSLSLLSLSPSLSRTENINIASTTQGRRLTFLAWSIHDTRYTIQSRGGSTEVCHEEARRRSTERRSCCNVRGYVRAY